MVIVRQTEIGLEVHTIFSYTHRNIFRITVRLLRPWQRSGHISLIFNAFQKFTNNFFLFSCVVISNVSFGFNTRYFREISPTRFSFI